MSWVHIRWKRVPPASAPGRPGWDSDKEWMWKDVHDELISCGPCQTMVVVRGAFPKHSFGNGAS